MQSNIIVALDFADRNQVLNLVHQLSPQQCKLKVGLQLFSKLGPEFVSELMALGYDIFLDLKYYDIPQTVAKAVHVACQLGVWMLTVHVQGGEAMLRAARSTIDEYPEPKPLLMGVTVLTSLDATDIYRTTRKQQSLIEYTCYLAQLAFDQSLDGVICSPHEALCIRQQCGKDFMLVTPGIRLNGSSDDQKRIATPLEAMQNGADYLVIGRPITASSSPMSVLTQIQDDIIS